jgi:hypothetical protein
MEVKNRIDVLEPRYNDRVALIKADRVEQFNIIYFPKAKSMSGDYFMLGSDIKSYPTEQLKRKRDNSTYTVYAVPLDDLERIATPENEVKQNKQERIV